MNDKIITLIKDRINELEISKNSISKEMNNYKYFYDILVHNGKVNYDYFIDKLDDDKMFEKLDDLLNSDLGNKNTNLRREIMNILNKIYEIEQKRDEAIDLKNINQISNITSLSNVSAYNLEIMYDEYQTKFIEKVVEFVVPSYEKLLSEREKIKDQIRICNFTLKNIKKNKLLNSEGISLIDALIMKSNFSEETKNEYYTYVNDFLLMLEDERKKQQLKSSEKREESKKQSNESFKYIQSDDKIIEEKEEEVPFAELRNFILSLKSLETVDEMDNFMEFIKYNYNIKYIILLLISICKEQEDEKIINYLENYLYKITDDSISAELNLGKNTVLYYGLENGKNKILDDISKISDLYYKDILNGLDLIKNGNVNGKISSFTCTKGVFKIRVNDIRIIYKRLNKSIIILCIACKKSSRGNDIANKSVRRSKKILNTEQDIIDNYDLYRNKSNEFDNEIYSFLKKKVKSMN